jgi:hypothetical protein
MGVELGQSETRKNGLALKTLIILASFCQKSRKLLVASQFLQLTYLQEGDAPVATARNHALTTMAADIASAVVTRAC